jgi:ADP-heptose:LPS heptosyltransferase
MPTWRAEEHEVQRWCRLLRRSGIDADPEELEIHRPGVDVPARAHDATLLHPGAASPARRWPPERWAAVARAEHAAGRPVVITGSPAEAPLARCVAALGGLPGDSVFAGAADLLGLAALVGAAAVVVCGDTGVGHLATALGVPSVLLFGPTPPALWGPPAARHRHRVLWTGRRGDPHAEVPDPGLLHIDTESVLAELRALRPLAVA